MGDPYLVVHQYSSSLTLAVSKDIIREGLALPPPLLKADSSCSLLGVQMSSSDSHVGREVRANTLLPFVACLDHAAPVGVVGLCREGVFAVAKDVFGETVVTCNLA